MCVDCFNGYFQIFLVTDVVLLLHHIQCACAFSRHVESQVKKDQSDLQKIEGHVYCPNWTLKESEKCRSLPFSDTYLAKHVNADVFALHLASRMKITELKLVTEMEE